MHISEKERDQFAKTYFSPETVMNFMHIYNEISRLCKIRDVHHSVLLHIEQREVFINRLKEIAKNVTVSGKKIMEDPLLREELPQIIQSLRECTINLIEAIILWRVRSSV